ncbi:MAG: hypothetical protein DDT26_00758 [Dehalococcoidia bacterium]|nr:hypothetical protein [Chloroflexota bacterium]
MNIFGFEIKKSKQQEADARATNSGSFAVPQADDGAVVVAATGANFAPLMDLDGSVRSDAELVTRYRELSLLPELEMAIDEIVNELVSYDTEHELVELNTDRLASKYSKKFCERLREEFKTIIKLMDFNNIGYELLKRWYVDGRIYYHVIIDEKNPGEGIKELRYVDPRKIRKVREIIRTNINTRTPITKVRDEYYVYSERGYLATAHINDVSMQNGTHQSVNGVKIHTDSIVYGTSGLMDQWNRVVLSYLHKAIRPMNQLRSVEDAQIIYRLVRAPERRLFYIDVGNLPKLKAEQYVNDLMTKHKNRTVYDANEGSIRDDRRYIHMMEDYWFPRREGGKGTEVTTLPGGQNLSETEDIEYFRRNLFRALSVPTSRLIPNESGFSMGKASEITREEVKFQKFIDRLRMRFSIVFKEAFKRQLLLKNVVSVDEIDTVIDGLTFDFKRDNYFTELKEAEIRTGRNAMAREMADMVGAGFYSKEYIKRKILRQSDADIDEIEKQNAADAELNAANHPEQQQQQQPAAESDFSPEHPQPRPKVAVVDDEEEEQDDEKEAAELEAKKKKQSQKNEKIEDAQLDLLKTLNEALKNDDF